MSSPPTEKDLKLAGHAPALKVGGVRIPTHNRSGNSESEKGDKSKDEAQAGEGLNAALKVSTSPPKSVATNISGAVAKGHADFPAEAIQSFHEKPLPTHDNRAAHSKPNIIHQPRK